MAIYEVNNFLSIKAWILINIIKVKAKGINPVPVKWVLNIKEEPDRIICLKSRNVVKECIEIPEVDYIV